MNSKQKTRPEGQNAPHRGDAFLISRGAKRQVILHPIGTKPTDVSIARRFLPGDVVTLVISKKVRKQFGLEKKEVGTFCHDGESFVVCKSRNEHVPLYQLANRGVEIHVGDLLEDQETRAA